MTGIPPIEILPEELLSIIFWMAMAEAEEVLFRIPAPRQTKPEAEQKVLTSTLYSLNATCRRWRQVAVASPRIWTTIVSPFGRRRTRRHAMLLLLERSGTRSLSVYDSGQYNLSLLCGTLAQHNALDRVTRLQLTGMDDARFSQLRPSQFPQLQELQLEDHSNSSSDPSPSILFGFLRRHISIRSLKINGFYGLPRLVGTVDAVTLPDLELLALTHESEEVVNQFSQLIIAPKLHELRLKALSWNAGDATLSFAPSTLSNITHLVLAGELLPSYMFRLLTLLNDLRILQLTNPWERRTFNHTDMIRLLNGSEKTLLPSLHTLSLHQMQIRQLEVQCFLDSRAAMTPPAFRCLQISHCFLLDTQGRVSDVKLDLHGCAKTSWTPPFE